MCAGVLAGAGNLWGVAIGIGERGIREADLEVQRAALVKFAEEMYGLLARCDQRAKGEQSVRGLLWIVRRTVPNTGEPIFVIPSVFGLFSCCSVLFVLTKTIGAIGSKTRQHCPYAPPAVDLRWNYRDFTASSAANAGRMPC